MCAEDCSHKLLFNTGPQVSLGLNLGLYILKIGYKCLKKRHQLPHGLPCGNMLCECLRLFLKRIKPQPGKKKKNKHIVGGSLRMPGEWFKINQVKGDTKFLNIGLIGRENKTQLDFSEGLNINR